MVSEIRMLASTNKNELKFLQGLFSNETDLNYDDIISWVFLYIPTF